MEKRCIWSNKKDANLKEVTVTSRNRFAMKPREISFWVLPEYEQQFRKFNEYSLKFGPLFLWLMGLLSVALIIVALFRIWFPISVGIIVVFEGIVVILFPFTTPETVRMLGLKKSITIARTLGITVIALGVWIALVI